MAKVAKKAVGVKNVVTATFAGRYKRSPNNVKTRSRLLTVYSRHVASTRTVSVPRRTTFVV